MKDTIARELIESLQKRVRDLERLLSMPYVPDYTTLQMTNPFGHYSQLNPQANCSAKLSATDILSRFDELYDLHGVKREHVAEKYVLKKAAK